MILNSFKLIINSIYLVLIWLTLHALFALMIPKIPTFVEIEITRLSFRLCTLKFRKSNDLNFIPKSLSTEQKGTDILGRQITYSIVKFLKSLTGIVGRTVRRRIRLVKNHSRSPDSCPIPRLELTFYKMNFR